MKIESSSALLFLLSAALSASTPLQAQRHHRDHSRDDYRDYRYRNHYNYRHTHIPYYYERGFFYRPYGAHIQVMAPPVGIRVSVLPPGYRSVYMGHHVFFYFNGIFYRQAERDYEVVRAPLGAELPELPTDARVVIVDDEKYYELNGNYFKERIRSNGEIWYEVVGKNGRLQTDGAANSVSLGSLVSNLPAGSKVVIINNEKFFLSPGDVYYQEIIQNNQLLYKVSGVPQDQ